ncbi:tRNA (5-methylaminomethyl-2-thiouridine)(34)-methyltransferase MnmD [Spirulina sp. 06S082]|uniref:tRNA (5-methylaminomethyl-2-thiouridine)(34)-methyltransferase MnmD n=1 Tax=Spirulina sp. 06S082 TaxID=3110248 RepID=UPI002B20F90F|nr:MnmC family methyltransferase [Spirulina sp. 06S082]MEA5467422.1 MnmC family methyltransferase [Spirulina sp. 06S082]
MSWQPRLTDDGSFTFYSGLFDECFHSFHGARQEAEYKYVEPCQLYQKAKENDCLHLLDICYGLGYNSAAAIAAIWSAHPTCYIKLVALELDVTVPQQAASQGLLDSFSSPHGDVSSLLREFADTQKLRSPQIQADLYVGDARSQIQRVARSGFCAEAIFLDPFSPPKCPQLWTVEFLAQVSQCLHPKGRLATYSSAAAVRTALTQAGLSFGATQGVGRRSPGTIASFMPDDLPPLSPQEREHLHTRAAIPYRDPNLNDSTATILQRREREREMSHLEPTSRWKKRWTQNKSMSE